MVDKDYAEFFLRSKSSIALLECIVISHPNFENTYRIVRNMVSGVTVTHEDTKEYFYDYYPLKLREKGSSDDIDFGYVVEFGDLEGLVQNEIDAIATVEDGFLTKPTFELRQYRSDDLTTPLNGPLILEVNEIAFNTEGLQMEPIAPFRNQTATGELYTLTRFPMLRGTL